MRRSLPSFPLLFLFLSFFPTSRSTRQKKISLPLSLSLSLCLSFSLPISKLSISHKQSALLSSLPLALSRLHNSRARIPSATGALSAATSALLRAMSAGAQAAAATAAEGSKSGSGSSALSSSSSSLAHFLSACRSAAEFASAMPAVAKAWKSDDAAKGNAEEEEEEAKARSLLASSLLRLLPAACLPFAPLFPPSPSAIWILRPQTASALRRGEERALSSPAEKRASEAARGVAVAVVSALCLLARGEDGGEASPSFENSWGFAIETSAPPPKRKRAGGGGGSSDDGESDDDDDDDEEVEEDEEGEHEAAAVGRTPSALSLSLATYAAAWCSLGSEEIGATEKKEALPFSSSASAAIATSSSLPAAAASVPVLLDAAFARRSPGLVVAAAQLASVSAAAAAAKEAAVVKAAASASTSLASPENSDLDFARLLSHLSHSMSFTPSAAARNACYEAWEATLRAMPLRQRAAECARLSDEAATPPSSSSSSSPSPLRPPNAALEALALHHLVSLVASSWPGSLPPPPPSSRSSWKEQEEEKEEEEKEEAKANNRSDGGGGDFLAAAAALASAATGRLFPSTSRALGWGGSEVSLLDRVEPVAASLAALRLLLGRSRAAPLPASFSASSGLPPALAALVSNDEASRQWRRRSLVNEALLPLRAAASSAAAGLRAAAGPRGKECAGGGSEAGLAAERLLDALARVLELAEG